MKIVIICVIFFFLFRSLTTNWKELEGLEVKFSYIRALLSFAVIMAAWFAAAWNWGRVLKAFNQKMGFGDVFIIYFKSNLGKYLPGKIWQIVGSTYLAVAKGVPEGIAITASLIGQAYSVLSGLSLFAAAVALGLIRVAPPVDLIFRWSAFPALMFLLALAVRPDLAQPLLNRLMRIFRRQEVSIRFKVSRAIELFFLYLICWLLFGLGLWLFANALTPAGFAFYIPLTAIFAAAVAVGFLALFAPGGLGVREGIIALFLATLPPFHTPLPSAIAVGYRIIMTTAELIAFGLTWVVKWKRKLPINGHTSTFLF